MESTRLLLAIDSFINLLLGALLVFFPVSLATFLGIPIPESAFYPSVLGGVLFGIGIALAIEYRVTRQSLGGLGLAGAIAINMCGGIVLAVWLLRGAVEMPARGHVFLWGITFLLVGISTLEMLVGTKARNSGRPN